MEFIKDSYYKCKNFDCKHNDFPVSGKKILDKKGKCPECGRTDFEENLVEKRGGLNDDQKNYIKLGAIIFSVIIIGWLIWFFVSGAGNDAEDVKQIETVVQEEPKLQAAIEKETVEELTEQKEIPTKIIEEASKPKLEEKLEVVDTPVAGVHKVSFSYGTYQGETLNGKPHGQGTLTYHKSAKISKHDIKDRYAEQGQYVVGSFHNGELVVGRLYNADNSIVEVLNIGKR